MAFNFCTRSGKFMVLLGFWFCCLKTVAQTPEIDGWKQFPWWKKNNLRVIQTNLPDYEAVKLNADSLVKDLKYFSANTLIINAGGIMAYYPTQLDFHYRNPYTRPNTLSDVVAKCHAAGIKVIVRFDFSRIHKSIFEKHPDWCYISPKGERMINDEMYVVSINAPYVQDRAFRIVKEVLENYPVDGIFLNMPGYLVNNAYEGKYYGIDQNEADKKAFADFTGGRELPKAEDRKDSAYLKYLEFKSVTGKRWSEKLYELVKAKSTQIAICTYTDQFVDIIRHESQAAATLPYWPYGASDNVANAAGSYPDHIISNASIQQISFQSRFVAVEPGEVAIRFYENIAGGSGLDLSLMGDLREYEDERNYAVIKKIYAHHKKNEEWYGNYSSLSKILVIAPGAWPSGLPAQEYRGIQLMLKEAHIQYDIIEQKEIINRADVLKNYKLIILPDITALNSTAVQILKRSAQEGVNILATNNTLADDPKGLNELFSASIVNGDLDGTGNYIQVDDHEMFDRLKLQQLVSWRYRLGLYDFSLMDERYLPLMSKGRPGPPEITGGHEPMGFHAVGLKKYPKAGAMLFPSNIGRAYFQTGYEQYKNLFLDLVEVLYPQVEDQIISSAPARIELVLKSYRRNIPSNFKKSGSEGMILHCINLTGFSGNTYFEPLPVYNQRFSIQSDFKPTSVKLLSNKKSIPFTYQQGRINFILPELKEYEALIMVR